MKKEKFLKRLVRFFITPLLMFPPANNVLHSYMVMEATINVNIFMVPLSLVPNKKKDLRGYILLI